MAMQQQSTVKQSATTAFAWILITTEMILSLFLGAWSLFNIVSSSAFTGGNLTVAGFLGLTGSLAIGGSFLAVTWNAIVLSGSVMSLLFVGHAAYKAAASAVSWIAGFFKKAEVIIPEGDVTLKKFRDPMNKAATA